MKGITNAKTIGPTSTQYTDQSVTFALQGTPDFSDYPYMASKSVTGVTSDVYASVTYSDSQVSSGQYAPFCQTLAGEVRLYAKSDVGTQTIPTISVGMNAGYNSTLNNYVNLTGAQTIGGAKTFSYPTLTIQTTEPNTTKQISFNNSAGNTLSYIRANDYGGLNFSVYNGSQAGIINQRTYNASNTTDVVTIGSLQESTDVVHTTGNETTYGVKSFDSVIKGSNALLYNLNISGKTIKFGTASGYGAYRYGSVCYFCMVRDTPYLVTMSSGSSATIHTNINIIALTTMNAVTPSDLDWKLGYYIDSDSVINLVITGPSSGNRITWIRYLGGSQGGSTGLNVKPTTNDTVDTSQITVTYFW